MIRTTKLSLVIILLVAGVATAQVRDVTVTNSTGSARSKLELVFSGVVDNTQIVPLSWPAGCPTPTVTRNPDSTINLDFAGTDCIANGNTIVVRVEPFAAQACASGTWTNAASATAAVNCGTQVAFADPGVTVPTVSQWGLVIMTLLLLTAATIIFARRRPVAAH